MASKTAAQMVQEAKQHVENLTVEQVAAELEQGNALLVVSRMSSTKALFPVQ